MKETFLNNTESLCPICLKKVKAQIVLKGNRVFLKKRCHLHGKFECLHAWDDSFFYKEIFRISKKKKVHFRDTTVDITSKCNMNCPFCFSFVKNEFYEPSISDLMRKIRKLKTLDMGGDVILYGGEPTLRDDLVDIVRNIKNIGLSVNIATNGLELDETLLKKLDKLKLDRIQLQFDSMDDQIYEKLRKTKVLKEKLKLLEDIKKTNIDVTLFVVLLKGVNNNQINKIISFAGKNSEKIKSVIFTAVSPEGKDRYRFYHLINDDIMKPIETKFKISKEDFIKCTEFDIIFSNFLYKIGRMKRRNPAYCEALCYIYVKGSKLIPLNRLIDLEELTELFDDIIKKDNKNKLKMVLYMLPKIIKIKFNIILLPILFQVFISLIHSFLTKKPMQGNFKKTFGIIIAPSQNRYNIDYHFIKNCNLYADTKNGKFISFCEKLIFQN